MKACVLIVDDHAIIRNLLRFLFESEDFEVCDAANGAEGLQKAKDILPALIVLDLSMPVMNGLEAARALSMLVPTIPLLMFTNHVEPAMEREAHSAGISAVICKSSLDCFDQLLLQARTFLASPSQLPV